MSQVTVNERANGRRIDVEIIAPTEATCLEASDRYLARYHPCGYGTWIVKPRQLDDGFWCARGSRQASCD